MKLRFLRQTIVAALCALALAPSLALAQTQVLFTSGILLPNTERVYGMKGTTNDTVIKALTQAYNSQEPIVCLHYQKAANPLYGVRGNVTSAVARNSHSHSFTIKFTHKVELFDQQHNLEHRDGMWYAYNIMAEELESTPEMLEQFMTLATRTIPAIGKLSDEAIEEVRATGSVEDAIRAFTKLLNVDVSESHAISLLRFHSVQERVDILKEIIAQNAPHDTQASEQNTYSDDDEQDEYVEKHGSFRERAERLAPRLTPETARELMEAVDQYDMVEHNPHEGPIMHNYLKFFLSLPWAKRTKDYFDLVKIEKELHENHFGMDDVKDRVLDYLALRKLNPKGGSILCLAGPPGVGKTSICKVIANAVGKKFNRIALGGVNSEADIRGHRKTYIGALPGRILKAMQTVGTRNPVIALDEIDKLATQNTMHGDPSAALLEVLDPEQNNEFADHYLGVPFDLSQVLWIVTANYLQNIPPALRDRLDIIQVPGYTTEEKVKIGQSHLLPRILKDVGLEKDLPQISDEVMRAVINGYTFEAGVRRLSNKLRILVAKYARAYLRGETLEFTVDNIKEFLGAPYSGNASISDTSTIGQTNGLYYNGSGEGGIMKIEAVKMPSVREGSGGQLQLTGSLKDVIKESARTAYSYVRAHAKELNIDPEYFAKWDVHLHIPEGATPKDGPSAGGAFATTFVSLFTNRPVSNVVAMTGEINLQGEIMPIGGVKEKLLGAHRAGVKHVFFPEKNRASVEEIKNIPEGIEISFAKHIDDILAHALLPVRGLDSRWELN